MLVHTNLNEGLDIFKKRAMKLLIRTFFTLLVIAFAGSSIAKGEEERNPQAEDVFHRFLSAGATE